MKYLSKYVIFLILLIIIFILLKEYKVIKIYESYKSGTCKVENNGYGEYSNEYKKCMYNLDCSSNIDCDNSDYACCFGKCRLKDNNGRCPKSGLSERCDLNNGDIDCLNHNNNLRTMCCKNPNSSLEWGRCVKSYIDMNDKKHCNRIDKFKKRIGGKCYVDNDCIDGGVKNNYGGTVKCCQGICENRKDGKCRPSEIGEKCRDKTDCKGFDDTQELTVCCNDMGSDIASEQMGICTKSCVSKNIGYCPATIDPDKCQARIGESCGSNILNQKDDNCIYGGVTTKCCHGKCTEMVDNNVLDSINNGISDVTKSYVGDNLGNEVKNILNSTISLFNIDMNVKTCPVSDEGGDCSIDTDCESYEYGGTYKCCNSDGFDKNVANFGKCTKPSIDATITGAVIPTSYCPNTARQKNIAVKKDVGDSCTLSTDCLGGNVTNTGSNVCCGGTCKPKEESKLFGAPCNEGSDCCSGNCNYPYQTCILPGTFTIMDDGRKCCNFAAQNVPDENNCVNKVCGV